MGAILASAYFLGMAAAIPMGPVGTLLLRVSSKKWALCLLSLLLLDLTIAAAIISISEVFLMITAAPMVKIASGVFLVFFAINGILKNKKQVVTSQPAAEPSIKKILGVCVANPGTYLLMASAFLFLEMSSLTSATSQWLVLASLSLGAVTWYHLVRQVFLKQSKKVQLRFEKVLLLFIAALGVFTALPIK
jgi:hypothetical protein